MTVTLSYLPTSEKFTSKALTLPVANHIARRVGTDVQRRIDALKIGQKMQDLPEELWHESFRFYVKEDPTRKGGPNLRLIRLDPMRPSLTVTAYIFNKFVHPFEDRFVTVREAARLQGFPDNHVFEGTLTSTQLQVGNAVPIPLARAVFTSILQNANQAGINRPLKALSLFSGAGGMDIGAEQTYLDGVTIDTRVAVEYWSDACKTLRGHYKDRASVCETSISQVEFPLRLWRSSSGETHLPDLVYGGPPCQSFSQAGKQKGLEDERGQLIFDFLRFVEAADPLYFVMENVSNLRGVGGGDLYQHIIERMNELGYNVSVGLLLAANYGAPQLRQRLFFLGCQKHLGTLHLPEPTHSTETKLFGSQAYATVGEAFSNLPPARFSDEKASLVPDFTDLESSK